MPQDIWLSTVQLTATSSLRKQSLPLSSILLASIALNIISGQIVLHKLFWHRLYFLRMWLISFLRSTQLCKHKLLGPAELPWLVWKTTCPTNSLEDYTMGETLKCIRIDMKISICSRSRAFLCSILLTTSFFSSFSIFNFKLFSSDCFLLNSIARFSSSSFAVSSSQLVEARISEVPHQWFWVAFGPWSPFLADPSVLSVIKGEFSEVKTDLLSSCSKSFFCFKLLSSQIAIQTISSLTLSWSGFSLISSSSLSVPSSSGSSPLTSLSSASSSFSSAYSQQQDSKRKTHISTVLYSTAVSKIWNGHLMTSFGTNFKLGKAMRYSLFLHLGSLCHIPRF